MVEYLPLPETNESLDGGFKYALFHDYLGKLSNFDQYSSKGLNPPTSNESHPKKCWDVSFLKNAPKFIGEKIGETLGSVRAS